VVWFLATRRHWNSNTCGQAEDLKLPPIGAIHMLHVEVAVARWRAPAWKPLSRQRSTSSICPAGRQDAYSFRGTSKQMSPTYSFITAPHASATHPIPLITCTMISNSDQGPGLQIASQHSMPHHLNCFRSNISQILLPEQPPSCVWRSASSAV
jgi:hypothetical protein